MVHLIKLQSIIEHSGNLLTLPDICLQLKKIVDDPTSSAEDLAELITKDPSLTARLLRIVNSSLYYFPRQISSVSQAITLIGTRQLYSLALATSAAAVIRAAAGGYVELKTLWKHSVYSAISAKTIGEGHLRDVESLFVAGLLCNIGTLAVVKYSPDIAMGAIGGLAKNQFPWDREKEVLGFSMAEVSGALLDTWKLPYEIVVPVQFQHEPEKAPSHHLACHALHAGVRLAFDMLSEDRQECLDYRAKIHGDSLAALGVAEEDLQVLAEGIYERIPEMMNVFML